MKRYLTGFVTLAGTLFASATVLAHTGTLEPGSFMNGLVHPLHGLDHVLALFALFHGQAHALEMPGAAAPILYGFGLMCSSGLILLSAMRLGWFLQYSRAEWSLRGAGVLTGVTGGLCLLGV